MKRFNKGITPDRLGFAYYVENVLLQGTYLAQHISGKVYCVKPCEATQSLNHGIAVPATKAETIFYHNKTKTK